MPHLSFFGCAFGSASDAKRSMLHVCTIVCGLMLVMAAVFRGFPSVKGPVDFSVYTYLYDAGTVNTMLPCSGGTPFECTMAITSDSPVTGSLASTCLVPSGSATLSACAASRKLFAQFLLKKAMCWQSMSPQCSCFKGALTRFATGMSMTGNRLFTEGRACFYRQPPTLKRTMNLFTPTLEHLYVLLAAVLFICPLYIRVRTEFREVKDRAGNTVMVQRKDNSLMTVLAMVAGAAQCAPLFLGTNYQQNLYAPVIMIVACFTVALLFDELYHKPMDDSFGRQWDGIYPFSFCGIYMVCILLSHAATGFTNANIVNWHVLYALAVTFIYCAVILRPSSSGVFRVQLLLFALMCAAEPIVFLPFGYLWTWLPATFALTVAMSLFLSQDHQDPEHSGMLCMPLLMVAVMATLLMFFSRASYVSAGYNVIASNVLTPLDNSTWTQPATVVDAVLFS